MKAKNIKSVLRRVTQRWAQSITDLAVRKIAEENSFVTGGAIASMLLGESVHDYDIYLTDMASAKAMAEYYVNRFKSDPSTKFKGGDKAPITVKVDGDRVRIYVKSAGVAGEDGQDAEYEYFEQADPEGDDAAEYIDHALGVAKDQEAEGPEKLPFRPVFLSSNAITLSDKIQVIIRFYGSPDEVHKNYDFVHCTNYWTAKDGKLVLRPDAMEALLARELRYVGSKYPLCSFIRTRKFIKRDWSITAGQYLKMAMQLNELDLKDIDVLEDQLVGVDAAYFEEIIRLLRKRDPDSKKVDCAYLVQLIDKIF